MSINVGTLDRALRVCVGLVLLYLALFSGVGAFLAPLVKTGALVIGLVMLVTAMLSRCPLYSIFGIRT